MRSARAAREREAIGEVWSHYRSAGGNTGITRWASGYHPRAATIPGRDQAATIRGRLQEVARQRRASGRVFPADIADAVVALQAVIDWAHLATTAGYLRRETNRRQRDYLGIGTICKADKWSDRLDDARQWLRDGRPVDERLGLADYEAEAEEAWQTLRAALRDNHRRPSQLDERPEVDEAIQTALQDVGGWATLGQATGRDLDHRFRREFTEAYTAARQTTTPRTTRHEQGT